MTLDKITNIVFDEQLPEPATVAEARERILQLSVEIRNIQNQLAHPDMPILDANGQSDAYFHWRRSATAAMKLKESQVKVLKHWAQVHQEKEAAERRVEKEERIRHTQQREFERSKLESKQALLLATVDIACNQIEHLQGMTQKEILRHYYTLAREMNVDH